MTTRSIVRTNRFRGGVRKERQWGITHANGTIVLATKAGMLIAELTSGLETTLGVEAHNWTVAALKFRLDVHGLATGTANDQVVLSAGIAWVGNDAFAAGAGSLPDPSDDNADWIWHSGIALSFPTTGAGGSPAIPPGGFVIDNKSMRKQRENNSTLVLHVRATTLARTVTVFISGRALFLLP